MPDPQPKDDGLSLPRSLLLVKRREQASLAVLVAAGLVFSWAGWLWEGGHRGGMVRIDRADPLDARYQVDVNRAEWPEFVVIPRIGETLARRIVEDRALNGHFRSVEDLERISGIGPRTIEQMRPYLLPIPGEIDVAATDTGQTEVIP